MIKTKLLLSIVFLFLFARSAEKLLFKKAREENTIEGYVKVDGER